ncbi:hypothetical protein ACFL54_06095 [Planctomycetota bacterium]
MSKAHTRKLPKHIWKIILGIFFLLLISLIVWDSVLSSKYEKKINAHIDELKTSGMPVCGDDLYLDLLPSGDNAAPLYLDAFRLLWDKSVPYNFLIPQEFSNAFTAVFDGDNYDPIIDLGDKTREEQIAYFKAFMAGNKTAFDLIRKASQMPHCHFELDYSLGFDIDLQNIYIFRNLTNIFIAAAIIAAEEGRTDDALAEWLTAYRCSNSLKTGPKFIIQLIRYQRIDLCFRYANDFLLRINIPLDKLKLAYDVFPVNNLQPGITDMIKWERALFLSYYSNNDITRDIACADQPERTAMSIWHKSYLYKEDVLYSLEYYRQAQDIIEQNPFWEHRSKLVKWRNDFYHKPQYFSLSALMYPAVPNIENEYMKTNTKVRMLKLVVALQIYQLENGRYPDNIGALPGDWLDPCSGKPLAYNKTTSGFTLFSPGPDGVINPKASPPYEGDDIIWPPAD